MPRILFHRDFTEYTGGHGKVWDYFRHAQALGWEAQVYLTPRSLRDTRNPWMAVPECIVPQWQAQHCDVLFLAGMDWQALPDPMAPPRPVLNLLQHVRHGWAGHPLRAFLAAPAQRICVSHAVADAVHATGEVNGPLQVVPAALDLPAQLPAIHAQAPVLIAGLKAPLLAQALAEQLRLHGVQTEVLSQPLPRTEYLQKVAAAAVAVTLPHPAEGFYLPALEAMALATPVVLADCMGSREYARAGDNCLLAELQPQALAEAVLAALQPARAARLREQGLATAQRFTQAAERAAFAQLLQASMAVNT